MFEFSGELSLFAKEVQSVLNGLDNITDCDKEDSFTIVVYRIDPRDNYEYLTGFVGLREPEPMFGPQSYDDVRNPRLAVPNPRGFRVREGIEDSRGPYPLGQNAGTLWISRRHQTDWSTWQGQSATMIERLSEIFASHTPSQTPLFPELWFEERQARDQVRSAISSLGRRPSMTWVPQVLASEMEHIYVRLLSGGHVRIGIYLFTGRDWVLCRDGEPGVLPATIDRTHTSHEDTNRRDFGGFLDDIKTVKSENAFEWVHRSVRPVLLRGENISPVWLLRAQACGWDRLISNGGHVCLIPILDFLDRSLAIGILAIAAWNTEPHLSPAHLYLGSRLSHNAAGYLAAVMSNHGFPWWPDASLTRGNARVNRCAQDKVAKISPEICEIVSDLMPTGSKIAVEYLEGGLTDSDVMRLVIVDEQKIPEIPRILKVGPTRLIADELWRYNRYVHNKAVGGQSRVDIARGYSAMDWRTISRSMTSRNAKRDCSYRPIDARLVKHQTLNRGTPCGTAAIVYTFVGPGERAQSWTEWGRTAGLEDIERGIGLLIEQLKIWHGRSRKEPRRLEDVIISNDVIKKQKARAQNEKEGNWGELTSPRISETVDYLLRLKDGNMGDDLVSTCIAHGDTHGGNVFSLIDNDGGLKAVALIDWGKVQSGHHPLTDISILIADLIFRIRWDPDSKDETIRWGENLLNKMRERFGYFPDRESTLVIAVHLCRMLAWRNTSTGDPWFSSNARSAAWNWIKSI